MGGGGGLIGALGSSANLSSYYEKGMTDSLVRQFLNKPQPLGFNPPVFNSSVKKKSFVEDLRNRVDEWLSDAFRFSKGA